MDSIPEMLDRILDGEELSPNDLSAVFARMFVGGFDLGHLCAILAAWRVRGESGAEIQAGASAMRSHAVAVAIPESARPLLDNCGTGGDGSDSFNVSTAAAIVAAAGGVRVAKHGNRAISSKCGSADLLFAAGFPVEADAEASVKLLEKSGLTFFFAPNFHPVMRQVGPARKTLAVRTIFNLLGPLANPIKPELQLIGVAHQKYLEPMAEAASRFVVRGLVAHSRDGMDEISPAAITELVYIADGKCKKMRVDPKKMGINADAGDLAGGDAAVNLQMLQDLLAGKEGGVLEAVALNAGACLWLAEKSDSLEDGYRDAREIIVSGKAKRFFAKWQKQCKEFLQK